MGRKKRRSKQFKDSSTVIDIEQARQKRQEKRQQKKKTERAAAAEDAALNPRQDRRRTTLRKRKNRRRLIIACVTIGILLLLGFSAGRIFLLKHELYSAKKQKARYEEEKAQLEKELEESNDLDTLEEQARDQMRLVRPGETLYIFPEEMTTQ